ncbi:helix-turn-helix domain-containing protein [Silvanigrella paludirubra]|jgi:y4mF family transcriptional regulator|uniref:Helix-turn-helix domain-containing protein n=1 Tax=Silvanigrella paludirubra TaxID=2499159 RepID=A0A6N6VY29_9BACT|nr:helix-turn-helix domain-containing protein [Silvanigrella paludirubra]KAB8039772.1 helix-turn-helix domain-containing protein [Silvanigrella paludirubra]
MPEKKRRNINEIEKNSNPIALFVREKRKYLGYTQYEFSKRIGVGLRFLKELELGKETLRMDKVNQVLKYLGARLEPTPYREEDNI